MIMSSERSGSFPDHSIMRTGSVPRNCINFPPFLKPNVFDSLADTQPELKLTAQMNQDFARFQAKQYSTMPPMFQVLIQMAFGYLNNRWRDC